MGATGELGRDGIGDDAVVYDHDTDWEDEYGPPSQLDLDWYVHSVVSLGYPRVQRGEQPMEGQLSLDDLREALDLTVCPNCKQHEFVYKGQDSVLLCAVCDDLELGQERETE